MARGHPAAIAHLQESSCWRLARPDGPGRGRPDKIAGYPPVKVPMSEIPAGAVPPNMRIDGSIQMVLMEAAPPAAKTAARGKRPAARKRR